MPALKHRAKIGRAMGYKTVRGTGLFLAVLVEVSEYSPDLSDYGNISGDYRIHIVVLRL